MLSRRCIGKLYTITIRLLLSDILGEVRKCQLENVICCNLGRNTTFCSYPFCRLAPVLKTIFHQCAIYPILVASLTLMTLF